MTRQLSGLREVRERQTIQKLFKVMDSPPAEMRAV